MTTILKNATYKPILTTHPKLLLLRCHSCQSLPVNTQTPTTKAFWQKTRRLAGLFGMAALILPTKSLTNVQPLDGLEKVTTSKVLTVATTPEHLFTHDGHAHGFGYDAVNRYADYLGATLNITSYDSEEEALKAVKLGEADIMISHRQYGKKHNLASTPIHCTTAQNPNPFDSNTNASLVFHQQNLSLISHSQDYLCAPSSAKNTHAMAQFYRADSLDSYSIAHFERTIKEQLPLYQHHFKRAAKTHNHDWQLLVAISYQESHLEPDAISRTGVQGLMMLTNDTAAAMGVSDRTDAEQSIQGGAKYLARLKDRFDDIPETERLWFVLAAYNMGPNAVRSIQDEIAKAGHNPALWSNFYTYLSTNAHKNSRYVQCMHYVTNIRTYFEDLKA